MNVVLALLLVLSAALAIAVPPPEFSEDSAPVGRWDSVHPDSEESEGA